jgi:hypothetical protein
MSRTRNVLLQWVLPTATLIGVAPSLHAQIFDYKLEGVTSDAHFGIALSRVDDVDGDGCEDFAVGAEYELDGLGNPTGAVSVFSGRTGALLSKVYGHVPPLTGWGFGHSIDGKIDVDGDGFSDVLIGAPLEDVGGANAGRVCVFSPHLGQILYDLYGSPGERFGDSVRSLNGDLDGDGVDDFAVGADGADTAYVFSGRTGAQIFKLTGQSGSGFGYCVGAAGKMDGDGLVDFLVSSPFRLDSSGFPTGRVSAFSGKNASKLWSVDGSSSVVSDFGLSLAHPNDLDGDGRGDCVVGAPWDDDLNGVQTGSVTVISGKTGAVLYTLYGDALLDEFGYAVRGAGGDLDGDGVNDFLAAAPVYSRNGNGSGYVRLFSGATGQELHTFVQQTTDPLGPPSLNFQFEVAVADVDGDGRRDVLVGNTLFDGHGLVEVWRTAAASWSNYGTGWAGTNGIPTITAEENPVVGQPIDIDVSNSLGATTPGYLAVGLATTSIHLKHSGTLLVDAFEWIVLTIDPSGITISDTLPDDPTLYGVDVYLQAIELDAGASKGLSFTPGLDLLLGFP